MDLGDLLLVIEADGWTTMFLQCFGKYFGFFKGTSLFSLARAVSL